MKPKRIITKKNLVWNHFDINFDNWKIFNSPFVLCLALNISIKTYLSTGSVGGIVVSIAAFQAVDPGSIPGQRNFFYIIILILYIYVFFSLVSFRILDIFLQGSPVKWVWIGELVPVFSRPCSVSNLKRTFSVSVFRHIAGEFYYIIR